MEFAVFFIGVVLAATVGVWISREMHAHSAWIRQPAAWLAGLLPWCLVFLMFLPTPPASSKNIIAADASSNPSEIRRNAAAPSPNNPAPTSALHKVAQHADTSADALAKVEAQPDLGITPEQFEKRFNAEEARVGSSGPISFKVKHSGVRVDTVSAEVSKYAQLEGSLKKSNQKLTSIFMITATDNTSDSIISILSSVAEMFAAANDSISLEQAWPIVKGLMEDAKNSDQPARVVGSVRYKFWPSKMAGYWFIVEPVSAKHQSPRK